MKQRQQSFLLLLLVDVWFGECGNLHSLVGIVQSLEEAKATDPGNLFLFCGYSLHRRPPMIGDERRPLRMFR